MKEHKIMSSIPTSSGAVHDERFARLAPTIFGVRVKTVINFTLEVT